MHEELRSLMSWQDVSLSEEVFDLFLGKMYVGYVIKDGDGFWSGYTTNDHYVDKVNTLLEVKQALINEIIKDILG